ncbi:MAG: carbamoyltransferase HypF [Phycisphaerae bacterium]
MRKKIQLCGQVQGIGFRPYVYKLAKELGLTGIVYNHSEGAAIEVQGEKKNIDEFISRLKLAEKSDLPLLKIISMEISDIALKSENTFEIKQSQTAGAARAEITPDMAICKDCLRELFDKNDFRYRYPFINCTNCGPRYSIIKTIPYDRPNTTMSAFKLCDKCNGQYGNPADRRFHAQPVACAVCGPKIKLCDNKGSTIEADSDSAIRKTAELLAAGKIAAIKGLGGYHLACDAENDDAVKLLRTRKMRDYKPFAIMAGSVDIIRKFACVDEISEKVLKSIQSPIVLLPKKTPNTIAASVAAGVNTFGFMLPYTPLHYLLFAEKKFDCLIMTSGNVSDEPLICKDQQAFEKLADIADVFLIHDREIYRQVDDSVVHIVKNEPVPLRRSRGFVPQTFVLKGIDSRLRGNDKEIAASSRSGTPRNDIFAAGADLKNTFCLAKQNRFAVSEHIGDLADSNVYKHWIDSIGHLKKLLDIEPEVFACDLHPNYFTSQYTRKISKGKKLIEIQHHWAHIASVIAEHNIAGSVIGLVADGTGFGTDGAVWGCECLIASLTEFKRFGHLAYYPLGGGDSAAKQAIRPLLGLAAKYNLTIPQDILESIESDGEKINIIKTQLEKNINTVQTSSLGRLFDAVAAVCGLGGKNNFEAELPMALEAAADKNIKDYYTFELINGEIQIGKMLEEILTDTKKLSFRPEFVPKIGTNEAEKSVLNRFLDSGDKVASTRNDRAEAYSNVGTISAKFHNTIAQFFLTLAKSAKEQTGINIVAVSGGVFCNRFLLARLIELLEANGFEVFYNRLVPANDGGISLGQAAIAANRE